MFDMTINDDMDDAGDDTAKVLAENERAAADKKVAIAQQIANNLGHQSDANPSFVAELTKLSMNKRGQRATRGKQPDEEMASGSQQQPPPPPPPGATPVITTVGGGNTIKGAHLQKQTKGLQVKGARGKSSKQKPG